VAIATTVFDFWPKSMVAIFDHNLRYRFEIDNKRRRDAGYILDADSRADSGEMRPKLPPAVRCDSLIETRPPLPAKFTAPTNIPLRRRTPR